MKKIKFLLVIAFSLLATISYAHEKTDTVKVYGNCGMCKERIEKAATFDGVTKADWNEDTKILTVTYNADKVKLEDIQKKVAAVGHDTEKFAAENDTYRKLPGCCKYERKAKEADHKGHKH